MKSEWRVTKNPMMTKPYGIYRLRNTEEVNHSGNRESKDTWYSERTDAQAEVERLNKASQPEA